MRVKIQHPKEEKYWDVYPYNLLLDVFDSVEAAKKAYVPGLETALGMLNDMERLTVDARYRQGKTIAECGEQLHVSAGRIHQILYQVHRKLRWPSRYRYIRGETLGAYLQKVEEFHRVHAEYEEASQMLKEKNGTDSLDDRPITPTEFTPLCETNISMRTFNGLKWVGYKTLGDLTKVRRSELMRKRHLGETSVKEVEYVMWSAGLQFLPEQDAEGEQVVQARDILLAATPGLGEKLVNILEREGILTLGDLSSYTASSLLRIRNVGPWALDHLISALNQYGLSLMDEEV